MISRDKALMLADALAAGWLNELCERLNEHQRENNKAISILDISEKRIREMGGGEPSGIMTTTTHGGCHDRP